MSKNSITDVLSMDWNTFVEAIRDMSERELKEALKLEIEGRNRAYYLERLHMRYSSLRRDRERAELLGK